MTVKEEREAGLPSQFWLTCHFPITVSRNTLTCIPRSVSLYQFSRCLSTQLTARINQHVLIPSTSSLALFLWLWFLNFLFLEVLQKAFVLFYKQRFFWLEWLSFFNHKFFIFWFVSLKIRGSDFRAWFDTGSSNIKHILMYLAPKRIFVVYIGEQKKERTKKLSKIN
jgi:hypothetical protein